MLRQFEGANLAITSVSNNSGLTITNACPMNTTDSIPLSDADFQDDIDAIRYEMERRNNNIAFVLGKGLRSILDASVSTVRSIWNYFTSHNEDCKSYEDSYMAQARQVLLGETPFELALKSRDLPCIRKLVKGIGINHPNFRHRTPLEIAIATEDPAVVEELINLGADIYQITSPRGIPCWGLGLEAYNSEVRDLIIKKLSLTDTYQVPTDPPFEMSVLEFLIINLSRNKYLPYLMEKLKNSPINPKDLPRQCATALVFAILEKNEEITNFLLGLDINIHARITIPQLGLDTTPYQAAMVSNKEIKKMFRTKSKLAEPQAIPCIKNPWTVEFENIIKMLIANTNFVTFSQVSDETGNTFFNPILNGQLYPLNEIIYKMDWTQVDLPGIEKGSLDSYTHSPFINSFLKGETHYQQEILTKKEYWIFSAGLASELNKGPIPDPDEIICRGQSQEDRLVRGTKIAFISTSSKLNICQDFKFFRKDDEPVVIFEENQGISVQSIIQNWYSYQFEHIILPTTLTYSELFKIKGEKFILAKTKKEIAAQIEAIHRLSPGEYTQRFENLINQIVQDKAIITTLEHINLYGQVLFDVIIDGIRHDMYDIISHMDWAQLKLTNDTINALPYSKYHFWDEQVYTNLISRRISAQTVSIPIKLYDVNPSLKLLERADIPKSFNGKPCNYSDLYLGLNDIDKGLIFQYTSITSTVMNSFLKGSVAEFKKNIDKHQSKWNLPAEMHKNPDFNIQDPLQWWVYTARFVHALNKIKPSPTPAVFCRGQTHMDKHRRLHHPAPISASTDFKTCQSYAENGQMVIMNNFEGKDITGLSFHPAQREFIQPPALLVNYKKDPLIDESPFEPFIEQVEATVRPSR